MLSKAHDAFFCIKVSKINIYMKNEEIPMCDPLSNNSNHTGLPFLNVYSMKNPIYSIQQYTALYVVEWMIK